PDLHLLYPSQSHRLSPSRAQGILKTARHESQRPDAVLDDVVAAIGSQPRAAGARRRMLRIHKRQPPAGTLLRFQNVQSLHRRVRIFMIVCVLWCVWICLSTFLIAMFHRRSSGMPE
ncbi:HCMVUL129, partial [Human betaherpesvirus 5]|uniref:Uncharacterized protein UL129 n=1 Tax=Human cytomegalovirus (strain AD169) TaxID=10360 RepID=UL129_HCMVA